MKTRSFKYCMKKYINIHTHHIINSADDIFSLYNISQEEFILTDNELINNKLVGNEQCRFSAGIHPWHIAGDVENDVENKMARLDQIVADKNIIAIGETGLDKLCAVDFNLQKRVFAHHIAIAAEHKKPLIIHCVKAWSETMQMLKDSSTRVPVLFHGFRGKPHLAGKLLDAGFYLSFGALFNKESLKITPLERIFMETDNQNISIKEVYKAVAEVKGVTVEELVGIVGENFRRVFFCTN